VMCSSCIFTVFGVNMFGYYRSKEPTQLTLRYDRLLSKTMELYASVGDGMTRHTHRENTHLDNTAPPPPASTAVKGAQACTTDARTKRLPGEPGFRNPPSPLARRIQGLTVGS